MQMMVVWEDERGSMGQAEATSLEQLEVEGALQRRIAVGFFPSETMDVDGGMCR